MSTYASMLAGSPPFYFLKSFKNIIYLFSERGWEGKREGEKHQCVVASHTPPNGDLAHHPGMYPDWELNQQPFGSQAGSQPTEPHQPGPILLFITMYY